jgi:hypothetical protein
MSLERRASSDSEIGPLSNGFDNPSPYLRDQARLADVIAEIQAPATYKFYTLDFAGWADRIFVVLVVCVWAHRYAPKRPRGMRP